MLEKIIFMAGLCGSGKTTFARNNLPKDVFFIDDIKDIEILHIAASAYEMVAIADVHLCYSEVRQSAIDIITERYPGVVIEWLFWENNFEKAWKNVESRCDGRLISKQFVKHLSEVYHPDTDDTIKIR